MIVLDEVYEIYYAFVFHLYILLAFLIIVHVFILLYLLIYICIFMNYVSYITRFCCIYVYCEFTLQSPLKFTYLTVVWLADWS